MNKELVDKLIELTVDQYIKDPKKLKQEIIYIVDSLTGRNMLTTSPLIRKLPNYNDHGIDTIPCIDPYILTCGGTND